LPAWRDVARGEPTFAGVQATDRDGVTLRVLAPTKPGEHFALGRELRLRLLQRLRNDGLAWPPDAAAQPGDPPVEANVARNDPQAPDALDATPPTKRTSSSPPRRWRQPNDPDR
ncbi:MAG: hypothetical protein M3R71_02745, partial [Actinomycetota bacterium]|nr:hypothetical protein [Actinomycetota bacterium]